MAKITIVRTREPWGIVEKIAGAIERFLFVCLQGMWDDDEKRWRRFWQRVRKMEAGELVEIDVSFPRNPRFHRKYFALLRVGFDAWQPDRKRFRYRGREVRKSFDAFREEVTVLAGYYVQTFKIDGTFKLEAQSIAFGSMDEDEFEALYSAVVNVLLSNVLARYANRDELDAVIERIMEFTK